MPAYYHWIALELKEKFEFGGVLGLQFKLDNVATKVPSTALNDAVEQLIALSLYNCENEHELSSLLTRTVDRFLFCDAHTKLGAALSQFPLEGTKRADLVVVKLEHWIPSGPVIATNDSKMRSESFDMEMRQTQCYTMCGLTRSPYKFPYSFGLPYCKTRMAFEMHLNYNTKYRRHEFCQGRGCGEIPVTDIWGYSLASP